MVSMTWIVIGCHDNSYMSVSPSPLEVCVQSAGRLSEVICAVRCGIDGTMFLTEAGRVYACGK